MAADATAGAATLQGMAATANLASNYVLGGNIDALGANFTSIGNDSSRFTGTFDGLDHTIANLNINLAATDIGLFGYAGAGSAIRNVGLVGGSVTGNAGTGALVGSIAGAAGGSPSNISNSYATGNVRSKIGGGGADGLVGSLATNSGNISGSDPVSETKNGPVLISMGLTDAQLRTLANFKGPTTANDSNNLAWNFSDVWVMPSVTAANRYPIFKGLSKSFTVTAGDVSKTYDGQNYSGANSVAYSSPIDGIFSPLTTTYGGDWAGGINAGSYAITAPALTPLTSSPRYAAFLDNYYSTTYVTGTLTINPAALVLTGSRSYDGKSAVEGSVLTATGVNGETFAVTGAGDASNLASANVQSASQLASLTGLALGDGSSSPSTNSTAQAADLKADLTADLTADTTAAPTAAQTTPQSGRVKQDPNIAFSGTGTDPGALNLSPSITVSQNSSPEAVANMIEAGGDLASELSLTAAAPADNNVGSSMSGMGAALQIVDGGIQLQDNFSDDNNVDKENVRLEKSL